MLLVLYRIVAICRFTSRGRWGWMSGVPFICVIVLRGCEQQHLPTLKKPTDDMTNARLAVNMHAVHRTAFLVVDLCLSSSIG
ncbi:protein of unknown function [Pseudomonas mediterranea]